MELLKKMLSARKEPFEKVTGMHDVIENLRILSKGESDIAEFYQFCGDILPDDRAFWHELAKCERTHADLALNMADLIEMEPGKYRPGKGCNLALVRVLKTHINDLVVRMRAGKIEKKELLAMAADIENSVVELSYKDMVETKVPEYLMMARRLDDDTDGHRSVFEERLRNMATSDSEAASQ